MEQYSALQVIRNWCTLYVQNEHSKNTPKPTSIHLFVTGGAGTGRSHLIKLIYQTIKLQLRKEGDNPECRKGLLLAPTGTAAFNIDGMSIHAGFLLRVKKRNDRFVYR